jgi:hypothetical protein
MNQKSVKILVIAGILSLACTTRVSEWVLLNALPNQYTLICFHNGTLTEEMKKKNTEVSEQIKSANIQFKTVTRAEVKTPYYGLYYEDRLFSKYDSPAAIRNLTASPLREMIAADLMSGKLCVMVYLKTENKDLDEKGLLALRKALDSSPFGSIISIVELSRNNREEAHFVSLLLNVEDDLKSMQKPMLYGVFGRFKALEPLVGNGITEENISLMIDYLTAECSCLIKDDLPGTDILFTSKWENPQPALLNKIIDANLLPGE